LLSAYDGQRPDGVHAGCNHCGWTAGRRGHGRDDATQLRSHPLADSGSSPILGVDPGITGGIAFLFANRVVAEDIPTAGGEVDVDTLVRRVREMQPALAIIERANAMPKQGVSSTFKYGVAYGALRTVVALCNIPYRLVTPGKWKNHFRLDADKEQSRALAIQFWPGCGYFSRKKDHGRAEAALIARYGAETRNTGVRCHARPR
jgi:crossover junction endodeoxyribonuclease RuvC